MPTIRKRGKRFNVQARVHGNGVRTFYASATFDTYQQAQLWGLATERNAAESGATTAGVKQLTVFGALEHYRRAKSAVKPLSRGMTHSIDMLQSTPFSALSAGALPAHTLTDWAFQLRETGVSPATLLHHLAVLRAGLRAAATLTGATVETSGVERAIATLRQMRVVAPSTSRNRRVSDAELKLILQELRGNTVRTDLFVELAVALPRRRSELLAACWAGLSADRRVLTLHGTKDPRRHRVEHVPVPPEAARVLAKLPQIDARILPFKPESVSAAFQRAVRAVGLHDVRLHDLRHEGISRLFEQGLDIQEVALISGHTSWAQLRRYTHLKPESVVEKLNARAQENPAATAQPALSGKAAGVGPRRKAGRRPG